jgi:hypothetical protein
MVAQLDTTKPRDCDVITRLLATPLMQVLTFYQIQTTVAALMVASF